MFVNFVAYLQVQWQTLRHSLEECANGGKAYGELCLVSD